MRGPEVAQRCAGRAEDSGKQRTLAEKAQSIAQRQGKSQPDLLDVCVEKDGMALPGRW